MGYLNIDDIVNVVVSTAAAATPRDGFNIGLIVGKSAHISTADRCKTYSSLAAMVADGFLTTDPEYIAANLYFSQTPAPSKVVVGVCGDGETYVEAITACRAANNTWYGVYCAGTASLSSAEHQAVAAYIETIRAAYFYSDSAAADLTNVTTDIFSVLKALSYKRSVGLYSATAHAAAAVMGFAMGANDGTADSAYTLAYKTLAGVTPDDLTESEVGFLQGKNANYYVTRGGTYKVLEQGVVADGTWFDEIIGLDQLSNDMQIGCMDVLARTRTKIPYTDAGALRFVLACNDACAGAAKRGFVAPGIWKGASILDLENGDTLQTGYLCQSEPAASQTSVNRSGRVCPPIYASVILAGAMHSATIKMNVE